MLIDSDAEKKEAQLLYDILNDYINSAEHLIAYQFIGILEEVKFEITKGIIDLKNNGEDKLM